MALQPKLRIGGRPRKPARCPAAHQISKFTKATLKLSVRVCGTRGLSAASAIFSTSPWTISGNYWTHSPQMSKRPAGFPGFFRSNGSSKGLGRMTLSRKSRGPIPTLRPGPGSLTPPGFVRASTRYARRIRLSPGSTARPTIHFVEDFCQLDRERLEIASARVRRAHAERAIQSLNAHEDQQYLIRREVEKKKRFLPLRKLVAQAPDVLTSICPCWMASPLSVSQILDADRQYFDFVIFDEASQILPEDAVPTILRGAKVVVAGDHNQLPPTTFFSSGDDDDDEDADLLASEGFESLLDLMNSFLPPWPLEWHYRSRDESLIAFSNHYIYADRLVTFPGPRTMPAVSHVLVQQEPGKDGEEESSSAEVRKVVDLILNHATKRPTETLGVIAMGIKHARRVEAALDHAIEKRPDLEDFFDINRPDRFFVKNLERVQGDERDAIILYDWLREGSCRETPLSVRSALE